jgi:SAM-dependent methyltransferase
MHLPVGSAAVLDDPQLTIARRELIRHHSVLQLIYADWYALITSHLPAKEGPVLELGSGGGFFDTVCPHVLTSDVMRLPSVDVVLDARGLPFADQSLRSIVGTNVLHHVSDIARFLTEAERVLKPGGRLIFIEPWVTWLSRMVYRRFHHEPFDPTIGWDIVGSGPLSGANGALPWIVFDRDRHLFEDRFPQLRLREIRPLMPVSYLLCGGVGRAWNLPAILYRICRRLERPFDEAGLFAGIVVESI